MSGLAITKLKNYLIFFTEFILFSSDFLLHFKVRKALGFLSIILNFSFLFLNVDLKFRMFFLKSYQRNEVDIFKKRQIHNKGQSSNDVFILDEVYLFHNAKLNVIQLCKSQVAESCEPLVLKN